MNLSLIIVSLIGTLQIAAAAPEVKGEAGAPRKTNEDMMKRFDRNNDGTLDETERAAIAKQRQETQKAKESATSTPPAGNRNTAAAGESAISSPVAENATAILEAADPNQDLVQKKLARHRAFVMTFDADKDGKLNETERQAALEAVRLRR